MSYMSTLAEIDSINLVVDFMIKLGRAYYLSNFHVSCMSLPRVCHIVIQ